MIPTNDAGSRYRAAVVLYANRVAVRARLEAVVERDLADARRAESEALEQVHTATQAMMASEIKKALGPDGGK